MAQTGVLSETVITELTLVVRLFVAAGLSAILGWERESAGKAAGLRTHMLVGVAAALFVITGELATISSVTGAPMPNTDPLRVLHAIVIGIGFLGAGVVYQVRERSQVKGLTTAASIWATAAVGAAVGFAHYVLAVATTILVLIILRVLVRFDNPDAVE